MRVCPQCGEVFYTRFDYTYCSRQCKRDARKQTMDVDEDWCSRLEDGMEMIYGFDDNYNPGK